MDTHISFINFIKAFNNANRNVFFEILLEDEIPNQIICVIYNSYTENVISVKTGCLLDWKPRYQGVRQGCPLSS